MALATGGYLNEALMIEIRRAGVKDAPLVAALEEELFFSQIPILRRCASEHLRDFSRKRNAREIVKKSVRRSVRSSRSSVFLAVADNKPVGYLTVLIKKNVPMSKLETLGQITELFVRETHRCRGIATKLKNEAEKWLLTKGVRRISLSVLPGNNTALSLYHFWGFTPFYLEMRKNVGGI